MGVSPISISEILAYADYHHIDDYEQRQVLLYRIKILDRVFLNWHSENKANVEKDS
jgi:hypothetical protein